MMGMFDDIHVTHHGIKDACGVEWFQTKDTPDQYLTTYTLGPDAILCMDGVPVDITGAVNIYAYTDKDRPSHTWIEWQLTFEGGKMVAFERVEGDN